MSSTQSPWIYRATANMTSGGVILPHPFTGLPVDIVARIGDDTLARSFVYYNHFHTWEGPLSAASAGGWTFTAATGTDTIAISTSASGKIVLTNDATGSAKSCLTYAPAGTGHSPFTFTKGKRMWCFANLAFGTVASTEFFMGFGTPDLSPSTSDTFPSDGIFLEKAASATDLDFHVRQDGSSTESTPALGTTFTDGTSKTVGFVVDLDGNGIPYLGLTPQISKIVPNSSTNWPDAGADVMTFMVGHRGASQTVTLDWLLFGAEY